MNTEQHPHDQQSPEPPPPSEAAGPERPDPAAGMAPEAIQAADVDREKQPADSVDVEKPTRGVDWVRASDLLSRGSGSLSRRGIDLDAKLARGTRHGIAVSAKYFGRQIAAGARRLPPLSAFGREEPAPESPGLGRN
ncbi:hypothetical protein [Brevibacterium casei]|uniref:hypothetical protein n=1 Tax=Brevibacterium casei TaxID=33889 RepID=UPI0013C358F0|nr:hypothetical protein [Brevibacterium casei]MBE4696190.1 hypothetical protein [Brevibacterium casei]MBY3579312.1 hypothetical protein [Brevibacterium casei]MCT1765473.1 hypothetical protein [Brevibacterium casei]